METQADWKRKRKRKRRGVHNGGKEVAEDAEERRQLGVRKDEAEERDEPL